MMNHSMKNQCNVKPGTVIEGKWHKNVYTIIKGIRIWGKWGCIPCKVAQSRCCHKDEW